MNLNDTTLYKIVVFKRSIYYTTPGLLGMRDVFIKFTKDGSKTLQGTRNLFLLTQESYEKLIKTHGTKLSVQGVRDLAEHEFTGRGYVRPCVNQVRN